MAQRTLDANLDIIQESGMEITLLDGDLNIIQKLDDEPNDVGGLTAAELKAKFDEAGNIIKSYINDTLVPEILSESAVESQRQADEDQRQAGETARETAESTRQAAEEERQSAETARETAEDGRETAEAGRETAEASRETAEAGRETAETGRVSAETSRASAETDRQSGETARAAAESVRETAESARASAEEARQTAESARVQAESAREAAQEAFFSGVTASALQLEEGAQPTASAAAENGSFRLELGIPRGEKGDTGAGLEVLGIYATLAELKAAHPMGSAGDAYAVGTAENNTLYVWSEDAGDWAGVGPLRGAAGSPGAAGKSAYQYAVDGGYEGSEAEFQALMGSGPWLEKTMEEHVIPLEFKSAESVWLTNESTVNESTVFTSPLYLNDVQIKGLAAPVNGRDAATKDYVDNAVVDGNIKNLFVTIGTGDWKTNKTYVVQTDYNLRTWKAFVIPDVSSAAEVSQCNVRCTKVDGGVSFGTPYGSMTFSCDTVPEQNVSFFIFFAH